MNGKQTAGKGGGGGGGGGAMAVASEASDHLLVEISPQFTREEVKPRAHEANCDKWEVGKTFPVRHVVLLVIVDSSDRLPDRSVLEGFISRPEAVQVTIALVLFFLY